MTPDGTVEDRLARLERAVAELQQHAGIAPPGGIERLHGMFKDEPAFDEVMRLCQEMRVADRAGEDDRP